MIIIDDLGQMYLDGCIIYNGLSMLVDAYAEAKGFRLADRGIRIKLSDGTGELGFCVHTYAFKRVYEQFETVQFVRLPYFPTIGRFNPLYIKGQDNPYVFVHAEDQKDADLPVLRGRLEVPLGHKLFMASYKLEWFAFWISNDGTRAGKVILNNIFADGQLCLGTKSLDPYDALNSLFNSPHNNDLKILSTYKFALNDEGILVDELSQQERLGSKYLTVVEFIKHLL